MKIIRLLTNTLIVLGYVLVGAFAGAIAGAFASMGAGSSIALAQTFIGGAALAGLLFGLRRCMSDKKTA